MHPPAIAPPPPPPPPLLQIQSQDSIIGGHNAQMDSRHYQGGQPP